MPFLGRDWRSDGDIWVRTNHGWETLKNWRIKIHENINYNVLQRLLRQSIQEPEKSDELIECSPLVLYLHIPKIHPCKISHGQSNIMFTQVVSSLDLAGALKDGRRVNYVYKLMEVLITQRLLSMSGAVQNQLFSLLDHALTTAVESNRNKEQLVNLLDTLLQLLKDHQYGCMHGGSSFQWSKYYKMVLTMLAKARSINTPAVDRQGEQTPPTLSTHYSKVKAIERQDDGGLNITELPYDVIRNILLYLCSQEDVISAGKASEEISVLVSDNGLWRDLCKCHFTPQQLHQCQQRGRDKQTEVNWYKMYTKLYRRFGAKETYADMLSWCSRCRIICWKLTGHPCKYQDCAITYDIAPADFIAMFNV